MNSVGTLDIRLIGPGQAEDYRDIRLAALRLDPAAFGSTYEVEAARPLASFEEAARSLSIFGAYAGDRIVGMVGFGRHAGEKTRHKGFLWGMFVHPAARRKGAGAGLLGAVLSHAASTVELVTLSVVTTNVPAIALYERSGFTRYGTEPRALKVGADYADELLMVRFRTSADLEGFPGAPRPE